MFGLTVLPLMGAAGVAIDYTQISATRTSFQAALDATALMMAKSAPNQSDAERQTSATNYFNALFSRSNTTNIQITPVYNGTGGSKLSLNATATVNTTFLNLLGLPNQVGIAATTQSMWGNARLRVALVLDNTGSMSSSGKMTALKAASKNLLTQLQAAANVPEDVYVSIVPFNKDVNVGSGNYTASWLRWDLWDAANGSCSISKYTSQSSCASHNATWKPKDHSTWNGCVTDRDQNYDTTNDAPLTGGTLYPAEQYSSCPAALLGLSNNWTSLSSKIDDMQPNGNTNQAIGLQMGWQSLTASPFSVPARDPNYTYTDVIILLTDGLNTEDRWYTNASSIDTRQAKTCANIKAAGIVLYTVQVNTGGDPTSTLLQSCASDKNKFFLLTSANEIVTTFNQIGTALSSLRLSM
ncbi:VWA domain-containing protein [Microbacteriaceae bacterium K1510]|nr:VWA domain-containing protein [Microbacteriaceae bacterium K1510]